MRIVNLSDLRTCIATLCSDARALPTLPSRQHARAAGPAAARVTHLRSERGILTLRRGLNASSHEVRCEDATSEARQPPVQLRTTSASVTRWCRFQQHEQYRRSHRQRIAVNHKQRINGSSRARAHRYTIALFGVAMTTALCCRSADARDRPVPAEARQACTPDAFRLCGAHIPDEDAVAACLKANIQRLSVQCRQVISVRDSGAGSGGPR